MTTACIKLTHKISHYIVFSEKCYCFLLPSEYNHVYHGVKKKWAPNESRHLNTYLKYSKILLKSANLFRFVPNKINDEHLLIEGKLPESMGELQLICPGIFA